MPGDGSLQPFIKTSAFFQINQKIKGLFRLILDSPEGKIILLVARAGLDPATNGL
jgi:hypothetical protein